MFKLTSSFLLFALVLSFTLLVRADESSCLKGCSSFNGTCCACCDAGDSCHENRIKTFCMLFLFVSKFYLITFHTHAGCEPGKSFCGCISSRAYCGGQVWGGAYGSFDTFGTCYDTSAHKCGYESSPNNWILCPSTHTPCFATGTNVYPICCANDHACTYPQ